MVDELSSALVDLSSSSCGHSEPQLAQQRPQLAWLRACLRSWPPSRRRRRRDNSGPTSPACLTIYASVSMERASGCDEDARSSHLYIAS